MNKSRRREGQVVPLIQAALDDMFSREERLVPLIQAAVERQAALVDAFR